MQMKKFPGAAAPFVVLALASAAPAVTIDDAVAPPTSLNGTSSWTGVGYIIFGAGGLGSGVLIDRQHVLTAAHVVFNQQPSDVTFNLTGLGEPTSPFVASSIAINPAFNPFSLFGDVA